jgi:glycosyltransferase involved in cell wall biosynthesis
MRRLLLIAFQFPPYPEVGGKRWTKLTKYLARQGWEIDVLTVPWGESAPDLMADVQSERIHIHRVASYGFHHLRRREFPAHLGGKIARRGRKYLLSTMSGRDAAEDARYWGRALVPAACRLIDERQISLVVSTGAPFLANWWASHVKDRRPHVHLITEFQDPWSDLPSVQEGDPARRARVLEREASFISKSDVVVTVTDGLSDIIRSHSGGIPVVTIPNGFDPEEITVTPAREREPLLVHAGNLWVGRERPLAAFLAAIRQTADGLDGLRVVSYGGFPGGVKSEYADLIESGVLEVHPRVPTKTVMAAIDDAFACLQFNAEQFPYLVSTKVFEYAAARRPVLSVNYGGEIEGLVNEGNLGWSVDARDSEGLSATLREVYTAWQNDPRYTSEPVGLARYDYANLALEYSELLERVGEPARPNA